MIKNNKGFSILTVVFLLVVLSIISLYLFNSVSVIYNSNTNEFLYVKAKYLAESANEITIKTVISDNDTTSLRTYNIYGKIINTNLTLETNNIENKKLYTTQSSCRIQNVNVTKKTSFVTLQ